MLRYQRPRESSLKLPARNSYFDRPYESHRPMLMPLKRTWPFLYVSARALNGTQPSEYFADLRLLTRQLSRCFLNCLRRVANSSQTACCVADPMLTTSHFEKPLVSPWRTKPDNQTFGLLAYRWRLRYWVSLQKFQTVFTSRAIASITFVCLSLMRNFSVLVASIRILCCWSMKLRKRKNGAATKDK